MSATATQALAVKPESPGSGDDRVAADPRNAGQPAELKTALCHNNAQSVSRSQPNVPAKREIDSLGKPLLQAFVVIPYAIAPTWAWLRTGVSARLGAGSIALVAQPATVTRSERDRHWARRFARSHRFRCSRAGVEGSGGCQRMRKSRFHRRPEACRDDGWQCATLDCPRAGRAPAGEGSASVASLSRSLLPRASRYMAR